MSRHEHREIPDGVRSGRRPVLVVAALLAALLLPYGVAAARLWVRADDDRTVALLERAGVAYIGPLTRLIGATADAQTAAVAGDRLDVARVRDAIADVEAVEDRYGTMLGTTTRWVALRDRLEAGLSKPPTGVSAYQTFSPSLDLELALVARVADTSTLILDPQLDSYYLMDSTVLRLPQLLVNIGRLSDLTRLASSESASDAALAAAAEQIRQGSSAVNSGLGKSFAATSRAELSQGLVVELDRFGASTTALVPPSANFGYTRLSPSVVQSLRLGVRDAVLALESAALDQLDALLASRVDGTTSQHRFVIVTTVVFLLLFALLVWLGLLGPRELLPRLLSRPLLSLPGRSSGRVIPEGGPGSAADRRAPDLLPVRGDGP